ncbi:hypothetical protein NFI00_000051 [Salmonella enterica]|nr:hypothetical protein [Salmonella enterica subsp. enterica serovar Minnesota]EJI5696348.1 hypothetical protein [Salmonella enterica]
MSELKNALFPDKLRGFMTLILLVIIMCLVLLSWIFPRQSSVSEKTLDTLQNVANQMERVGNNIERASLAQEKRNTLLEQQLQDRKSLRDNDYDALEQKYGKYLGPVPDGDVVISVQQPAKHEGSGHISVSTSATGKNQ